MNRGEYEISADAYGKVIFDQMILYSLCEGENGSALQNLFGSESYVPSIEYTMINPTAYKVHIETEQQFVLVFSEAYSPLWKARFEDSQEVNSIIAYSMVNSFYINRTGAFDLLVYFDGQTYADVGLKISALAFIVALAILVTPSRTLRKLQDKFTKEKSAIISKIRRKKV